MLRSRHSRNWPRFSLRALLLIVTLTCLWLGWRFHQEQRRLALIREIQIAGGYVTYDKSDRLFGYASERVIAVSLPKRIIETFGVERLNQFPLLDVRTKEGVEMADGSPAYTGMAAMSHSLKGVMITFAADGSPPPPNHQE
jgi:hypothetical protein